MAKKRTTKMLEENAQILTPYKSAVCGLGNAVAQANKYSEEGYDVQYCFAVVANDEEGKPVQAVYLLAKRRDA